MVALGKYMKANTLILTITIIGQAINSGKKVAIKIVMITSI